MNTAENSIKVLNFQNLDFYDANAIKSNTKFSTGFYRMQLVKRLFILTYHPYFNVESEKAILQSHTTRS